MPAVSKLDNGLKVLILEDHSVPLVAVSMHIRAGSVNEDSSNNGVSHILEHLVFKGTAKRGPGDMDREIESLGATLDAAASRDWTRFTTTVPSAHLEKALDVISDAVMNARLDERDLGREQLVVMDEVSRRESDPIAQGFALINSVVFTTHPYRLPIEGSRESLERINRQAVYDFYKRFYIPSNATLAIVGDVATDKALQAVKKYFGAWKGAGFPIEQAVREPPQTEVRRTYRKADTKLAYVLVGWRAPSATDGREAYVMDVLLTYAGIGYRSWMATELKDRLKIAQDTLAEYLTHRDPGVLAFLASVQPEKVREVEDLIVARMNELAANPLPETDLQRAKRSLLGNYAFECETFEGRARALGFYDMIDNFKTAVEYPNLVNSVTAEEVRVLAAKYLKPDIRSVVVIGPKEPSE